METSLKRFAPAALVLGLAGLVVTLALWAVLGRFDRYVQASLAVALLLFALGLLLNPGAAQRVIGGRQARYGANTTLMVVLLLGIVVILNYLAVKNTVRWDWSADRLNTLAPETRTVLQQLPAPVRALAFYSARMADSRQGVESLLEQYRVAGGDKFSYEFHDPNADPTFARDHGLEREDATIVLEMADRREKVRFPNEDDLTSALVRLSNPTERVVYFLTQHGEASTDDTSENGLSIVNQLLVDQNYQVRPLNLQVTATVPSDAAAIVVAGPNQPVSADETSRLQTYLDGGGALVLLLDPTPQILQYMGAVQQPVSLTEPLVDYLAAAWGVHANDDIVVDYSNNLQNNPAAVVSAGYGTSPITSDMTNLGTVYALARSVTVPAEPGSVPNVQPAALVLAGDQAWGETNFNSQPALDANDTQQPLSLAAAAENTQTKGRVVVFGDSDFAFNGWVQNFPSNARLLVKGINWATDAEVLVTLTPKPSTQRLLRPMTNVTANLIFLLTAVLVPLAALALGGVVWFQRRRHA